MPQRASDQALSINCLFVAAKQAEAEIRGWTQLTSRIAVPAFHGQIALPDRQLLAYEDVFATGRCELLLGDVIALADRDPAVQPRLDRLVDGVCADLRTAAEETGRCVPLAECVPDLYLDRIRPGGRLDTRKLPRCAISTLSFTTPGRSLLLGADPAPGC